jgi:hypothetical protein
MIIQKNQNDVVKS